MTMDPARLKTVVGSGLLAFPVTHFRADGSFDEAPYRISIASNIENGAVALFAPGGTGEFFSLTLDECRAVVRAAVGEAKGRLPIIAGVGYGTAMAVEFARAAEQEGAEDRPDGARQDVDAAGLKAGDFLVGIACRARGRRDDIGGRTTTPPASAPTSVAPAIHAAASCMSGNTGLSPLP